ncbi:MAG: glycoside hydrolase domain-containing protein, partial [Polaribacter sp.]
MKQLMYIFSFFLILSCQQKKEIVIAKTYQELADPSPSTTANWSNVPKGLQASVASPYTRFVKSEIPALKQQNTWFGQAWKGEKIYTQLVLWSNDSIYNVAVELSDFVSKDGNKITSNHITSSFVKYVITDEFAGGCGYRKPENFASSLAADVIEPVNSYAIKAKATRPIWIAIEVPSTVKATSYKSTLTLQIQGQKSKEFTLNLNVIDKVLPPPSDWKFHLDLWQNPYAVARYNQVKPWSSEHWKLLKPIMKRLANAGQKVITVSLNKRPWGGQTYDPFESMVVWNKNVDGTWTYNFDIFDNWVQFMMDLGIKKQINCY